MRDMDTPTKDVAPVSPKDPGVPKPGGGAPNASAAVPNLPPNSTEGVKDSGSGYAKTPYSA